LFGFIMAEILQKAFQNVIDEQGEMEDKKSQKAPAIDSVIVTGPDIIQIPKTEVKEVATDEGADAVQASSPEFNPKLPQSNMNDAGTNAAITAKEANERAPDEKAYSVQAAPPELNPKMTKPGENDAAQEASTTSPDPKKKQSPVSAVANESLMHSDRNLDALVGMDPLSKAAFHRTRRRHQKYTQAYLDHAFDIVHDFRKCDIRVLHEIEPKEGGAVQEDEDKKDCKPDPTEKPVEIGSPPSITTDTRSNQMVTGFPPTPDEFVYVEEDCIKYVHASGPVEIGCDFEAVDELVLSNLTRLSFQCTEYFDLIHDFSIFFDKWLTVDTVQFYQCWVSRSIGSYPENIFLLPLCPAQLVDTRLDK
jgi:hypothetical protein